MVYRGHNHNGKKRTSRSASLPHDGSTIDDRFEQNDSTTPDGDGLGMTIGRDSGAMAREKQQEAELHVI